MFDFTDNERWAHSMIDSLMSAVESYDYAIDKPEPYRRRGEDVSGVSLNLATYSALIRNTAIPFIKQPATITKSEVIIELDDFATFLARIQDAL